MRENTTTTGNGAAQTPYTQQIPLPYTNPDSCTISVTAQIPTDNADNEITRHGGVHDGIVVAAALVGARVDGQRLRRQVPG